MDINGNMELENFELVISIVSEGDNMDIEPSMITEEMALSSIKNTVNNNRQLNRNVNLAIYDLLRNDVLERSQDITRDK